MSRPRARVTSFAVTLACSLVAGTARAEDAPERPGPGYPSLDTRRDHIELTLGYGQAMPFAFSGYRRTLASREFFVGSPRWGLFATDVTGDPPFRGAFEILAQVNVFSELAPRHGWAAGVSPLFRLDFWTGSRFVPYVDAGAGLMGHTLGKPELGGHFAFQLQLGIGAHIFIVDEVAITVEYRFHHLSNAFIFTPDYGINTSLLLGGVSLFF